MEERAKKKAMIEAVLFISGEPVELSSLKSATGIHEADLRDLMDELVSDYEERGGGVLIGRVAGGYQMFTNPGHSEWIMKLRGTARKQKLSMPALETLAIVAYRQPITKAEIEDLRGVNSDGVVKALLEKRFVRIVGKKEAPGKPMLYGTTVEFLQYFGLNDLSELPTLKDLEREEAA
jgi:segregation and condensation protein B